MLRLLHTSDWHLGHRLYGQAREAEHQRFLNWLLEQLEAHQVDALLVAGDVFDLANPPTSALAAWYAFLADTRRRLPDLDLVVVAGNHDSPARIEAPGPLFEALGMRAVGRLGDSPADGERVMVPLRDRDGEVAAWCAALPYLRPADLQSAARAAAGVGPEAGAEDPWIAGHREIYQRAADALQQRAGAQAACIATGHCHLVGGQLSEMSERRIQGGGEHALPSEVFPPSLHYVALGHLHRAQRVGGLDHVRYCGSPIPLSMAEAGYQHQVLRVDFDGPRLDRVEPLRVPRSVEMLHLPAGGGAGQEGTSGTGCNLDEVLQLLHDLPARSPGDLHEDLPFLEVCVRLDQPEAGLARRVRDAVADRAVRLVRLQIERATAASGPQPVAPALLQDWTPQEVLRARWKREFSSEPDAEVLALFQQVVQEVEDFEE